MNYEMTVGSRRLGDDVPVPMPNLVLYEKEVI